MQNTIHGLIKKRGEHKVAQKAADALKTDLDAIDRALVLCNYQDDPKAIAPCGKYKQLFGRNELKLTIIDILRQSPADDEAIAPGIMDARRHCLSDHDFCVCTSLFLSFAWRPRPLSELSF
ncbi:hypothetical protein ROLI_029380 [Roseobacter fucihabitans]|uniref:Uncharacterized protein n=1 Tax=Roseobacter fucihabitans TaxID=1537242 RepID=A0ABZ2BVV7_9RHOB|nr:hypothetical protein [Roseobacter litoralis]MBC6964856.1 hypothetical protein [Roseobacter litoralis]